jgi:mono/diheme cytochrome c family protein
MRPCPPLPAVRLGYTARPSVGVPIFTPKGWDNLAQGEALGSRSQINRPSLKGWDKPSVAALQAAFQSGPGPRSVAPGYVVPPLRGEEGFTTLPPKPTKERSPSTARRVKGSSAFLLTLLFLTTPAARADELTPRAKGDLAIKARAILKKHCSECHGGAASRGTVRVLEHPNLVATGPNPVPFVAPKNVEASQVIQFLEDGSMPPGDRPRPSDEEIKVLKDWVAASAPGYPVAFDDQTTLKTIIDDLDQRPDDAPNLRYFSLAHLVRDDAPPPNLRAEEMKLYQALLWCGVKEEDRPQPVDAAATLYRFDISRAKWDRKDLFYRPVRQEKDIKEEKGLYALTLYDLILLEYPHGTRLAADHPLAGRLNQYFGKSGLAVRVPFLRADWVAERLAVKTPLAEDLKSLAALAAKLDDEKWPALGKEDKMPCGPATRPFAGRNPVPAAAKPEAPRPILPLSAWYTGDTGPDKPPFKQLKVEVVDMKGDAVESVKKGAPFRLKVTTENQNVHFVLLAVMSNGLVEIQPTNKGGLLKADDPRPFLTPDTGGAFIITSILTGEAKANEYFVLLASPEPIPEPIRVPVIVRSRHDPTPVCEKEKRFPVSRFLFDTEAKFDPSRVVRKVIPVTVEK